MSSVSASSCGSSMTVDVIDPINRTGKIIVPLCKIAETKGLSDYLAEQSGSASRRTIKDLSLCLLSLKGKCFAGSRCNQVHVDRTFIEEMREKAASSCNCCAAHGDVHATGYLVDAHRSIYIGGERYELKDCARTGPLDHILRATPAPAIVSMAWSKICRLHREGRCKFGKDCKYVHLCKNASPSVAGPTMAASPKPLPTFATRAVVEAASATENACDLSIRSVSESSDRTLTPPSTARHSLAEACPLSESSSCLPLDMKAVKTSPVSSMRMCQLFEDDDLCLHSVRQEQSISESVLNWTLPVGRCLALEELAAEMSQLVVSPFTSPTYPSAMSVVASLRL